MRFSSLDDISVQKLNRLASLQSQTPTSKPIKTHSNFKILSNEPSTDDIFITNQTFSSERNDIKRVFTGSKFLSLTEDLLRSHIQQCIHKNDPIEQKVLATEPAKIDSSSDLFPTYKLKEDSLKTAPSLSPGRQDFSDVSRERDLNRIKKPIEDLLRLARLEQYMGIVEKDMDTLELYSVRACDLEAKLEEYFPKMKLGHRRRLGVIILEQRGEYKRQGRFKGTENAALVKEMSNSEEAKGEKRKISKLQSLEEWLGAIKMGKYKENFVGKGYEDYEFIMLMMCNEYLMLNDMKLKNDIGIEDYEDRNQILTKLYRDRYNLINIDMDTQIADRQDTLEDVRVQVGCKGCSLF